MSSTTDVSSVNGSLTENGLPASDITPELLRDFAVAEGEDGFVVGSVGLQTYDSHALLRSLTVAPSVRNAGMGSHLLAHAESLARHRRISELWLLTTTASDFFRQKDYLEVTRSTAPAKLQATTQFAQLCTASAVCMRKIISPR